MRISTTSILLFPTLLLASLVSADTNPNPNPIIPLINTLPTSSPAHHSNSSSTSTPPSNGNTHILELRQAVGAAGGAGPALPDPTQMSPVTTYLIRGPNGAQTPVPFTQLFVKVPDQWPAPTPGSIGLGTIQGVVGAVRTNGKRSVDLEARATGGVLMGGEGRRERGRLVRRKTKGKSDGGADSGGGRVGVSPWAGVMVVAFGIGVVVL